jgi:hypothetical protein
LDAASARQRRAGLKGRDAAIGSVRLAALRWTIVQDGGDLEVRIGRAELIAHRFWIERSGDMIRAPSP